MNPSEMVIASSWYEPRLTLESGMGFSPAVQRR